MHYRPMPHFDPVDIERFWSQVDIVAIDRCWIWKLSAFTGGYGQFKMSFYGARWNLKSHRVAFYLFYGIDPLSKLVCHQCDNPACCNPHHLFLGTEKDNMQDAKQKNRLKPQSGDKHGSKTHPERWVRGERVAGARLEAEDIRRIRALYLEENYTHQQIADLYNVDRQTVGKIVRAENWQHVTSEDGQGPISGTDRRALPGARNPAAVLTESQVHEIRKAYARGGLSYNDLSKSYGVSIAAIRFIITRKTWKHVP